MDAISILLQVIAVFITGFFCSLAVHIIDRKSDDMVEVVSFEKETKSVKNKKYK